MKPLVRFVTAFAGSILLAVPATAQDPVAREDFVLCDHVPLDIADATGLVGVCSDLLARQGIAVDDEVDGRLFRAEANGMLGAWEAVHADVDRVFELAPRVPWAYLLRGRIALIEGNPEKAYADFDFVLTETDTPPEGFYLGRGTALAMMGDYPGAILDYSSEIELFGTTDARILRAQALERMDSFELALEDLDLAVLLDGGIGKPYLARGDTYFRIGQCGFARADYERAASMPDTASTARDRLAALSSTPGRTRCLSEYTGYTNKSHNLYGKWRWFEGGGCPAVLAISTYPSPRITIAPDGILPNSGDPRIVSGLTEERRNGWINVYRLSEKGRDSLMAIRLDALWGIAELFPLEDGTPFPEKGCKYAREVN